MDPSTSDTSQNTPIPSPQYFQSTTELQPAQFAKIGFFGTSSATPCPFRCNVSSICIQMSSGSSVLIDCGESTQNQLMCSLSMKMNSINAILITHLHGDHFYGLFGLLCTLNQNNRKTPLVVVGPKGIKTLLSTVFDLPYAFEQDIPDNSKQTIGDTNMVRDSEDGLNYLLKVIELEHNQPVLLLSPTLHNSNEPKKHEKYRTTDIVNNQDFVLPADLGFDVMAIPIVHRVPCFGYVLHERNKSGTMDGKKAKEMGARPPDYVQLKLGHDVELPNGSIIHSKDVMGSFSAGKTIAIIQDTSNPWKYRQYFSNLDVMIHECTYDDDMYLKSVATSHSTASMAAEFAFKTNTRNLILTHFSSRYVKEFPQLMPDGSTTFYIPYSTPYPITSTLTTECSTDLIQLPNTVTTIVPPSNVAVNTEKFLITSTINLQASNTKKRRSPSPTASILDSLSDPTTPSSPILKPNKKTYPFHTKVLPLNPAYRPSTHDLVNQAQYCIDQLASAQTLHPGKDQQNSRTKVFPAADFKLFQFVGKNRDTLEAMAPDINLAKLTNLEENLQTQREQAISDHQTLNHAMDDQQ